MTWEAVTAVGTTVAAVATAVAAVAAWRSAAQSSQVAHQAREALARSLAPRLTVQIPARLDDLQRRSYPDGLHLVVSNTSPNLGRSLEAEVRIGAWSSGPFTLPDIPGAGGAYGVSVDRLIPNQPEGLDEYAEYRVTLTYTDAAGLQRWQYSYGYRIEPFFPDTRSGVAVLDHRHSGPVMVP